MTTVTIYPTTDGSIGSFVNESAGTSNLFQSIDEGTGSPNDSDFVQSNVAGDAVSFGVPAMAGDFGTATAVTLRSRLKCALKGDVLHWSTIRLYKSDGSTALTASSSITDSSLFTTHSFSPSITGGTAKTDWDNFKIKLTLDGAGSQYATLSALQIEVTYTPGATGRIHRAARLDGLGGVGQKGFNPVLRSRLFLPPKRSIFLPAFNF